MHDSQKVELWKRRFFEAQAAAEEFITTNYGDLGLQKWLRANAAITARLLANEVDDPRERVQHFAKRLHAQLAIYDSVMEKSDSMPGVRIENLVCGILRYRQAAETRGVRLTFKTPCDYCRRLNTAIYEKYTGRRDISCKTGDIGCTWNVGVPQ